MFIPHTPAERDKMLETIGAASLEDLFNDVPAAYRFPKLNLPPALTEMDILNELEEMSSANENTRDLISFLGAGAYHHYTPAVVDAIIRRGEFLTAYTPYQPEVSQGTLQAIFEYQSLVAALTGMDVSNASHYDGATAVAEAVIMAYHNFRGKRCRVVLSPALNPMYRQTARTYTQGYELEIVGDDETADLDAGPEALLPLINDQTSLVIVQYPDFFGRIFDFTHLIEEAHAVGALVAVSANPIALGLLKTPGEMGADIVVGEGQALGLPLMYGGPYLGISATRKDLVRKIAGRIVGESLDSRGQKAYVLTLATREQHIRREKATSNICTNVALMALASTVYMSFLGKAGMRQVAELCYHKAHYAAQKIAAIPGYSLCGNAPFFHEFMVCCPQPAHELNAHLLDHGILGGYELGKDYPTLQNHLLIAVTEMISREDIDDLCEVLQEVNHD